MIVIFRKNFKDLVFKVAPIKTPREEVAEMPPAEMSTLIPPQHAFYLRSNQSLLLVSASLNSDTWCNFP